MRFLVDENLRKEVLDFLESAGHEVSVPVSGSEDQQIAAVAQETKSILITHDQHFADILSYPPKEYPGIIRIKIHPPSAPAIIQALEDLFQKLKNPTQFEKKLIILEKDGFRIR